MNILKTGFFTAIATAARLLSSFLVMKIIALTGGAKGVAELGQFMSLASLLIVVAGGGIGQGVVKYVAEYREDSEKLAKLMKSALVITLWTSAVTGLLIALFYKKMAFFLFGSDIYSSLILVLGVTQFLVAIHNLIIAIINGMMDVKRLALIQILGAVTGCALPALLSLSLGIYGVLLGFLLGQAVLVLISLFVLIKVKIVTLSWRKIKADREIFLNLSKFSLMTLTSAVLAPIVQIFVRNQLADNFSWQEVGYWQAVSKVSEAYLLFVSVAISVYYLPRLSAILERRAFVQEIKRGYMLLLPITIFSAIFIYVFRDQVTHILFAEGFDGALDLYLPQLIGDVLKISSFILSYIMLAKAMTRLFVFSEVVFSCMYFGWVCILTARYGLMGSMYAFAVNYFLYLIFTTGVAAYQVKRMK